MHVRVSLFLNNKVQNPNGRFALPTTGPVPHGTEVPGLIRMLNNRGREIRRWEYTTGGCYTSSIPEGSFELFGSRVSRLGTNMYTESQPGDTHTSKSSSEKDSAAPNLLAKEELNLLARLMGVMEMESQAETEMGFHVNLFTNAREEEEEAGTAGGCGESSFDVINIQATQDLRANTELARIAGEFAEEESRLDGPSTKGDDLLAMMDELTP